MKLTNETKWDTRNLRTLCLKVLKKMGGSRYTRIKIITSKGGKYGGLASLGATWIKMRVPAIQHTTLAQGNDGKLQTQTVPSEFNVIKFTQILEHEIGHNQGLRHKEMSDWWNFNVDYVKDLKVSPIKEKPKQEVNLIEIRQQKAINKVKELQTKLKRTQTLLKKWQRKVKYYNNKT